MVDHEKSGTNTLHRRLLTMLDHSVEPINRTQLILKSVHLDIVWCRLTVIAIF